MSPGAKVQAVHVNQNDQLFSRLRYSAVGSAIVATAIVFFVDDSEALPIVAWIWLVMTLFLGLVRIYSAYAYSRDPQAEDDWRKWRSRFRFGTHVSGLLWAFAMWLLFPSGVPTHEVLLILGIAGIGGGAIATLSYDRKTLAIFLGILMAGSVSRLLWAGDELSYQLAFLVTLYFLFLIKGGLDIGSSYVELLQLKEDMKEHNLTLLSTAERVARIGNWQWDMVSETIELSANMARMCGKGSNRVRFDECLQLVHPDDRLRVQAAIDTVISTETEGNVEYRLRRNDDEEWVIMNQIIALHADSNGKKWIMGTVQDISMIKSAEQKIFAMAYYDELTGLANRGHFREYLSKQIKHARRKGSSLALLYIDLDNFKTVNDTLGHAFGDRFLKILADLLRGTLREDDFLARLGGDEFCIIMSDINDGVTPARAAERCLSLSRHAIPLAGKEIPPYMSIGIATFPQDGKNGDTLLRAADTAMYAAKHGGKQGFAFYDKQLTEEAARRMQLEAHLRQAVSEKQFELLYQPKISTRTGRISGVEALIRWEHPKRGRIPPDEFIDAAERIGLINDIGTWVLETACRQLRQWRQSGLDLDMAINISSSHFSSPDFVEQAIRTKERFGIGAGRLEIEITESVSRDPNQHIRNCNVLHSNGIRIAIDDFGTGYSSLSVLQQLRIDTIKIDRSFVQILPRDESSRLMVRTIVAMAKGLGFDIVAEGVETEEQAQFLCECGSTYLQGYLFSRPVAAEQIPLLVDQHAVRQQATANGSLAEPVYRESLSTAG